MWKWNVYPGVVPLVLVLAFLMTATTAGSAKPDICSLLSNCARSWCLNCTEQTFKNLHLSLDTCPMLQNGFVEGYNRVSRCPSTSLYAVCICKNTVNRRDCFSCSSSANSSLVCFSEEVQGIHIWGINGKSSLNLADECQNCSCSLPKNVPVTKPSTTVTGRLIGDPVTPRATSPPSVTTPATTVRLKDITIIIIAVCGGLVLILLIGLCCCIRRKMKSKRSNPEEVYTYIPPDGIMRSPGCPHTNGQHLACGHRHFHNEMYNRDTIGNAPPIVPPEIPSNHPSALKSAPPSQQYQQLNREPSGPVPAAAVNMGNDAVQYGGPCPHCRRPPATPDRSATAPLAARPPMLGEEASQANPYMPLLKKNNTCPSPATRQQEEPMCECHARPLSECSSVTSGSVTSDQQRLGRHAAAAAQLDQDPERNGENPYYFKVQNAVAEDGEDEVPSPTNPHYSKLEDAETLPLGDEKSPMLSDPNGNSLHMKPYNTESTDSDRRSPEFTPNGTDYMGLQKSSVTKEDRAGKTDCMQKQQLLRSGSVTSVPE